MSLVLEDTVKWIHLALWVYQVGIEISCVDRISGTYSKVHRAASSWACTSPPQHPPSFRGRLCSPEWSLCGCRLLAKELTCLKLVWLYLHVLQSQLELLVRYTHNLFHRLGYAENSLVLDGNLYSLFILNLHPEFACSCIIPSYFCSFHQFHSTEVVSEIIMSHVCSRQVRMALLDSGS